MNIVFMEKALEIAAQSGVDIPVGAVIVKDNKVISFAHNEKETKKDVTLHAEIVAIRKAEEALGDWRLDGCEMYVTLEPCPMCAWAAMQARIKTIYFGAYDPLYGAFSVFLDLKKHSSIKIKGGILEEKCDNILKDYFRGLR